MAATTSIPPLVRGSTQKVRPQSQKARVISIQDRNLDKPKRCAKCREKKPRRDFPKHSTSSDGRSSYCKSCKNVMHNMRRHKNARFRLKHHVCTRIRDQLGENQPSNLYINIEKHLGYTFSRLKRSLDAELRAREGITLKESFARDYHLDHIRPLSSFPVQEITDQAFKDCWAISNLQMISSEANLAKGAQHMTNSEYNEHVSIHTG